MNGLTVAIWIAALGAAPPSDAGTGEIVVVASAKREIERILIADNLDAKLLTARQIVAAMQAIPQGQAPADFWEAYRIHLRAWQQFAALNGNDLGRANRAVAIDVSFDEVERIALAYGARLPPPDTQRIQPPPTK